MRDNGNYANYGLRSNVSPPQNPALTPFENDIYDVITNIEFRNVRNDFQGKLKEGINEIRSFKNLFLFADKSTNLCEMSDRDLGNNITSDCRKCISDAKHRIDKETKKHS